MSFKTSHCKIARLVVSNRCYYPECPVLVSNQWALRTGHSNQTGHGLKSKERTYGRIVRVGVNTNDPSYVFVGSTAATAAPPQSDDGSDEAESKGDNPPADNAEKGKGNAEEGNDDARSQGMMILRQRSPVTRRVLLKRLNLNDKGNPSRSIQEEPKSQINALNEVPKLKRLFKGYNMYWMAKTQGKYSMEMVREFYANYNYTLEKKAASKNAIKKEAVLHSVRVRAIPVDILERTITRWMANIIAKDKEGAKWVTGRKSIYKASLNFLAKSWWSIVRQR
ncbi:hypothetical protein HAX54_033851, partial [Datura stramonium]|nr:hypothetical protein [Datura stramonium]